eukprot:5612632-Prymnesium_polylepis.1
MDLLGARALRALSITSSSRRPGVRVPYRAFRTYSMLKMSWRRARAATCAAASASALVTALFRGSPDRGCPLAGRRK